MKERRNKRRTQTRERGREREGERERGNKQDIKLIFLLLYLPPSLPYSGRPGAGAGRYFNCAVGRDEKGIQVRMVCFCVCLRVCVCTLERQQRRIIGEAHLDTGHLSTPPLCPSNQHCSFWLHTVCVCVFVCVYVCVW